MSQEKKLILEMLSAGKINVEEAEKLLEAQNDGSENASITTTQNRKFLKVLVEENQKPIVNINIPIALAEVGLKLIPKDKLKIEGKEININELLELVKEGIKGELVNIDTKDNGKQIKVKIYIA